MRPFSPLLATTVTLLLAASVHASPTPLETPLANLADCDCPSSSTVTKTATSTYYPPPPPPTTTYTSTAPPSTTTAPTSYSTTQTTTTTTTPGSNLCANMKRTVVAPEPGPAPTPRAVVPRQENCSCMIPTVTVTVATTPPGGLGGITAMTTIYVTPTVTVTPTGDVTTVTATSTFLVPTLALARPTAIASGDPNFGTHSSYDDNCFSFDSPFPLQLYGQSGSNPSICVNGVLDLTSTQPADNNFGDYENSALPEFNQYPGTSVMPFWADLFITDCTPQGIYYEVDGDAPNRELTFEYYTSKYDEGAEFFHFLVKFQENDPNAFTINYLDVSDLGTSATVGAQSEEDTGNFAQYSNMEPVIAPGLELQFDSGTNSFTAS